ncbi:MAG: MotA/TolQ/ExbB proton channel family protein [Muribaculaceae bacterium]|nr:MotA/TolQ/ExbB proton channel family protein [Muribaculaceae bacterium]MDE7385860.1 MotA/TolQ/ExbB proton channel family protein [Muribaculaceae bacterium]
MLQIDNITDTIAATATQAAAAPAPELSVWDLCLQGGWLMIPLAVLSLVSIYILVERSIVLQRASVEDASFMQRIRDYIHSGNFDSARNLCRSTNTPYARLIEKGISRIGRPMNDVMTAIENTGNIEVSRLERGLPWLATTAAGAPMLGFLGTVIGMVQAFFEIASSGNSSGISQFADGIYTALVTTVAGLIVGVIALFAYNYLVARINRVMTGLEAKTMEFMDLLNEPA